MTNKMVCPCCGGTIELENDTEGACDTRAAFVTAGALVPDPECAEDPRWKGDDGATD